MAARYPRVLEMAFWAGMSNRLGVEESSRSAGISVITGRRLLRQAGGVNPYLVAPRVRLSFEERCRIEALITAGVSQVEIALRLGRDRSTIWREVRRNRSVSYESYLASNAQVKADRRARRPKVSKLAGNTVLCAEVQNRLEQEHSPKQIARRLRLDFPDGPEMWVTHETIYKSLYVQSRGELRRDLTKRLRTGRAVRKPRRTVGERHPRIANMINISERPAEVDDRAVPGHWEGDLIMGSIASNSAIGTLVERSTRFVMLLDLPQGHGATAVQDAMIQTMSQLPERLRKTLTWDQGREMSNHAVIAAATDLDIYFCDPHSPWQRGSNENTNGLLRQYFPKGTDISIYAADYLDHVAGKLNNRPRETLDWRTPAEALDKLLSEPTDPPGVALTV